MKIQTIQKQAYEQTYGPLGRSGSEEMLALWDKVKKLPGVEYLIIEPEKGENIKGRRNTLYMGLRKLAEGTHASFKVRLALNVRENHIVIWKVAKQQ